MATFKENPDFLCWKKIEYKNGIVKAAFRNTNGQDIEVKGGEMPHPNFRNKFDILSRFAKLIFQLDCLIEATAVEYPETGKIKLTASVNTPFASAEIKSKPIDFADIEAWDTALISCIDNHTGEDFTLLHLLDDIDKEAKEYLFKDKTAQQKIDFDEKM